MSGVPAHLLPCHCCAEGKLDATIQSFTHFSLHFLRQGLGCDAIVLDAQASCERDVCFVEAKNEPEYCQ